jgi:ribonucleotide monophosphatase NagD (HAD superfamily)
MDSLEPSALDHKEALFVAWLKRNSSGKTLRVCKRKLRQMGLEEGTLDILTSKHGGRICIQRQYGEEFVRLIDRNWADASAKYSGVEVKHHAQPVKLKRNLP